MHGPVKKWIEKLFIDYYDEVDVEDDENQEERMIRKRKYFDSWDRSEEIIFGYDFIGPEGPGANGFINGQYHPTLYKETKWYGADSKEGTLSKDISSSLRHDNTMQFDFPFIPNYLKSLNIEFECLPVWECRRYRKKYLYILEANNEPQHWMGTFKQPYETLEFPKLISDRALNDIRHGNAHLIINGARDGLDSLNLQPPDYNYLHQFQFNMGESFLYLCKKYSIPPNNITYLTSDLASNDTYDVWCNSKKLNKDERVNWVTTPFFVDVTAEGYKTNHPDMIKIKDINLRKKRTKKFLCYNGYIKGHRQIIGTFLDYKNHLNDGYFSMQNPKHFIVYGMKDESNSKVKYPFMHWSKMFFKPRDLKLLGNMNNKEINQLVENMKKMRKQLLYQDPIFLDKLPLKVDFDYDDEADPHIGKTWANPYYELTDLNYYKDSYFSIITEVETSGWEFPPLLLHHPTEKVKYTQGSIFMSEKTFHRMAVLHPFILVGHPYSLKKLKELGFKTFSHWIDESYDEEKDANIRMYKIFNEIDKLCSKSLDELHEMYIEMWPTLKHNYKRLYNYYDISLSNKIETIWNSL